MRIDALTSLRAAQVVHYREYVEALHNEMAERDNNAMLQQLLAEARSTVRIHCQGPPLSSLTRWTLGRGTREQRENERECGTGDPNSI